MSPLALWKASCDFNNLFPFFGLFQSLGCYNKVVDICLGNIFSLKISRFRIHLKAGGHFKGRQTWNFQISSCFNTPMWRAVCSGKKARVCCFPFLHTAVLKLDCLSSWESTAVLKQNEVRFLTSVWTLIIINYTN